MTNQSVARLLRSVTRLLAAALPSAQKTSDAVQSGRAIPQTKPKVLPQTSQTAQGVTS